MQKKFIIIIIILVVVIACGILILLLPSSNNVPTNPQTNQGNNQTFNVPSQNPPLIPSSNPTQMPAPPEIKEQFKGLEAAGSERHPVSFLEPKDQNGLVNLSQTMQELGAQIPASFLPLLYEDDYRFFSCKKENGQIDYGISLHAGNATGDIEKNITAQMRAWEPTMLKDLHNVLFPQALFPDIQLEQKLTFKDGLARYASVVLPDGTTSSINYEINNDIIYIADSLSCLDSGSDESFDP